MRDREADSGGGRSARPGARATAASPPPRPGPQVPLEPRELAKLRAWERRIVVSFAAAISLLAAWAVVLVLAPPSPFVEVLAIPFAAPLVIVGLFIQLGERCPRCGSRVSLRSRLSLPERCPQCSVSFRPATGS